MTKRKISLLNALMASVSENIKPVKSAPTKQFNVNNPELEDIKSPPFHVAVFEDDIDMIKLLLSRGENVDVKDSDGRTALCYALVYEKLKIADVLLKAGADINNKDNYEVAALITVLLKKKECQCANAVSLVQELIKRGADVNIKNSYAMGPLHIAVAISKNPQLSKCLIDAGADVNSQDKKGYTALHIAAKFDNLETVKILLSQGADINIKNDRGATALHLAIEAGYSDMATYLIDAGSDVHCKQNLRGWSALHLVALLINDAYLAKKLISQNVDVHAKDKEATTALTYALFKGALEVADALIEAGGDVNGQDDEGNTALHLICDADNRKYIKDGERLAKELLSRGIDYNIENFDGQKPLQTALYYGELGIAKALVDAGADIGLKDKEGSPCLFYAVRSNNVEMIKYALSLDADLDKTDNKGYTALDIAINNDNFEAADFLIEAGIDVNRRENSKGLTALHMIVYAKKDTFSLVEKLLSRGAKVDVKDSSGFTALSHALNKGFFEVADILIEAGGDVDSQDNDGLTTLMRISCKETRKLVTDGVKLGKELLARGASVNVKNSNGETALYHALVHAELEMAKDFIDAGTNLKCQDKNGNTPLHLVAQYGDVSLIRLCLSRGADINKINKEGNTALHIATMNKKTEIIRELLSRDLDRSIKNNLEKTALEIALTESNYCPLKNHFAVTKRNFNFEDATFSRSHLSATRKTPQFERLKSLGDNLDVEEDFKSRAPLHSFAVYDMNGLDKKFSKMSLKNKSEGGDCLVLFDFEQLQGDEIGNEIVMLFFTNCFDKPSEK